MSKVKAKHNKLNKPEDGNFGKVWNYICDQHDVKECYQVGFFDPLAGNLMAGDTIRILEVRDNRVRAMTEGIVLEILRTKQADTVEFFPLISKVIKFPVRTFKEPNKEEQVPATYIQGAGTVEYNIGKKAYMILCDGKIISQCVNKERAHAVARGDFPVPVYT
jgi:hypothetical protein|tara:strand:- start:667 stop:1155 length:489 start_codon:yes stop_codon:yes gene_type:complete